MKLVAIESPYAGDVARNLRYLRACMADCLARGEAPFASHGLYTQDGVLDDDVPTERAKGIRAGFAWAKVASARVVYADLGLSDGMLKGIAHAYKIGQPVETRELGPGWDGPTNEKIGALVREAITEGLSLTAWSAYGPNVECCVVDEVCDDLRQAIAEQRAAAK